ncbi:MAG: hypothetical protein JW910_20005, partial [Anaerolineae bacterium]|nr:hypothetical protein [Anaerolineae bacterium]
GLWGKQPAPPLVEAMRPFRRVEPVTLRVEQVHLTIYTRDNVPLRRDMLRVAEEEIIATYRLRTWRRIPRSAPVNRIDS